MQVHVCALSTRDGTELFATRSGAALDTEIAEICRPHWNLRDLGPIAGLDDATIVERYFEFQSQYGDEWRVTEQFDLADADHVEIAVVELDDDTKLFAAVDYDDLCRQIAGYCLNTKPAPGTEEAAIDAYFARQSKIGLNSYATARVALPAPETVPAP